MYLLDSNVFIQAKNGPYGLDIAPGFWSWIEQAHQNERVFTVEKVIDELKAGGDELAEWARNQPSTFALAVQASTTSSLGQLTQWVMSRPNYDQAAVSEFLQVADYYLVAQAHALGLTVVTHERPRPGSRKRVMIPDACNGLGVRWMDLWQVLRAEGVRFILSE